MTFYPIVLILHIVFVIIWIGGAFALLVLNIRSFRQNDVAALSQGIANTAYMFRTILVPASIGALICGLIMVAMTWSFLSLWVIIGLVGYVAAGYSGAHMLRPRAEAFLAAVERGDADTDLLYQGHRILRLGQCDLMLLTVIIADMVLKPGLGDVVTLAIMAAIVLAAVGYLASSLRAAPRLVSESAGTR